MPQVQTAIPSKTPTRPPEAPLTPEQRHRRRVMHALRAFAESLSKLAERLTFRFRSTEAAQAIREYVEQIGEIRTPAEARDILGEILESPRGAIKPPQLDQSIRAALQALFNAMDAGNGMQWPRELMTLAAVMGAMNDPYAAARLDLCTLQLASGASAIYVELGPDVAIPRPQSPAANHSNSVGVTPSPATSRSVTASRSRNVPLKIGSQSTMASAAT